MTGQTQFDQLSDEDLALRCGERPIDEPAWFAFHARLHESVFRYFQARLHPVLQKHADDLVQETFLKTFRALPNYDPVRSRLSTYVTAIGHNVLIDFLRHGRRMRDATVSLEDSIYCLQAQAEQDPAFLFRVAEALVDRLVDPSRIALARDLLLGVDPSEVATKHGVKPNQVYSIRSELRAILRDVASDLSFPGAKRFSRADEK